MSHEEYIKRLMIMSSIKWLANFTYSKKKRLFQDIIEGNVVCELSDLTLEYLKFADEAFRELELRYRGKYKGSNISFAFLTPNNGAYKFIFKNYSQVMRSMGIDSLIISPGTEIHNIEGNFFVVGVLNESIIREFESILHFLRGRAKFIWILDIIQYDPLKSSFRFIPDVVSGRLPADVIWVSSLRFGDVEEIVKYWENHRKVIIQIVSAANPFIHHPVRNFCKILDYVYIGKNSFDKSIQMLKIFPEIHNLNGFFLGENFTGQFPQEKSRFLYSAAYITIGIHVDLQHNFYYELSERDFAAPLSGSVLIHDNPLAAKYVFDDRFFPSFEDFRDIERYLMEFKDDEKIYYETLKNQMKWILRKDTYFHRVEYLLEKLREDL